MNAIEKYVNLRAELKHLAELIKTLRKDELSDMHNATELVMKAYFEGKADALALIADYIAEHLTEEETQE